MAYSRYRKRNTQRMRLKSSRSSHDREMEFTGHFVNSGEDGDVSFEYAPLEEDSTMHTAGDDFLSNKKTELPNQYSFDNPMYDSVNELNNEIRDDAKAGLNNNWCDDSLLMKKLYLWCYDVLMLWCYDVMTCQTLENVLIYLIFKYFLLTKKKRNIFSRREWIV